MGSPDASAWLRSNHVFILAWFRMRPKVAMPMPLTGLSRVDSVDRHRTEIRWLSQLHVAQVKYLGALSN